MRSPIRHEMPTHAGLPLGRRRALEVTGLCVASSALAPMALAQSALVAAADGAAQTPQDKPTAQGGYQRHGAGAEARWPRQVA
ncbi:MAG: hypothetical protein WDN04_05155 [Rhodospirillales bacterium]